MPKRIYAAWVFVVLFAAVLPIAVPYFIWPPNDYRGGSFDGPVPPNLYGGYAGIARYVPSSVSVVSAPRPGTSSADGCRSKGAQLTIQSGLAARVNLRGAYGIPFASINFSCETSSGLLLSLGGGLWLAGLAWLSGILAVSAPFIFVLKRKLAEQPGSPPLLSRPVPG